MAKESYVTRRVIASKTYNVYAMEGTTLKLLETIQESGKVSEKALAEKNKVKKVIIDCVATNKVEYGMTVEEFMKYAKVIRETTVEAEQEETVTGVEAE